MRVSRSLKLRKKSGDFARPASYIGRRLGVPLPPPLNSDLRAPRSRGLWPCAPSSFHSGVAVSCSVRMPVGSTFFSGSVGLQLSVGLSVGSVVAAEVSIVFVYFQGACGFNMRLFIYRASQIYNRLLKHMVVADF